ncbi:MAG: hypothetical protein FJ270_00420 [Planctomycetes bacterium]|nr:hypothetical protein [Planctomycetota bacterium]
MLRFVMAFPLVLALTAHPAMAQTPGPVQATQVAPGADTPLNDDLRTVMSPDLRGPTGFRQVYAIQDSNGNTKYMRGNGGLYMVYDRGSYVGYGNRYYQVTPPGATYYIGSGSLQEAMGQPPTGARRGVDLIARDAPRGLGRGMIAGARGSAAQQPPLVAPSQSGSPAQVAVVGSKEPVATGGGVMVMPLARLTNGAWPSSIDVQLDDGRTLQALVAVLENVADGRRTSWTRALQLAAVTPMAAWSSREEPDQAGQVIALLEMPIGFRGKMTLGASSLQPRWMEMQERGGQGVAAFEPFALDTPDLGAPNEWFRVALMARAQGKAPPEPSGGPADALFARHVAYLWIAALDRLERADAALAARARALVTGLARGRSPLGRDLSIAAWLADEALEGQLLDLMLDPSLDDRTMVTQVDGWLSTRLSPLAWVESDGGDQVTIGLANPLSEAQAVTIEWLTGASQVEKEVLGANELRFVTLARPDPSSETALRLAITAGYARSVLTVAPGRFAVVPPGLALRQFLPAASLAEVRTGWLAPVPSGWQTTASLRRTKDGWEVFIEALRPVSARGDAEDLVTVAVGSRPAIEIIVNSRGLATDGLRNAPNGDAPTVLTMDFSDRWRATVRLPASWVGTGPILPLGVQRSCRMTDLQCAGLPAMPWHEGPCMLQADLSTWPR